MARFFLGSSCPLLQLFMCVRLLCLLPLRYLSPRSQFMPCSGLTLFFDRLFCPTCGSLLVFEEAVRMGPHGGSKSCGLARCGAHPPSPHASRVC